MENMDHEIDKLEREKLVSLIQQNQVRIGKHNIRYTKSNKKNTLEHWEACMDSYEKLVRNIPKDILRVEKEVRAKFVSRLEPDRINRLLTFINKEIDVLIEKMESLYLEEFRRFGAEDQFVARVQALKSACQEGIESQMKKCEEALNQETLQSGRLPVKEICQYYEIKETLLHELNLLEPLQKIQLTLHQGNLEPRLKDAVTHVQQGIKEMARTLQDEGSGYMETMKDRKERKMQVARETLLFRDIVFNIDPLIEQSLMPVEQRNQEIVSKLWERIESFFVRGRKDWNSIQPCFKTVYDVAILQN